MGKKERQEKRLLNQLTKLQEEVSSKESWDKFYTMTDGAFNTESYVDWPLLQPIITSHLSSSPPLESILVPACGNSRLSENLYDAGFTSITNVDFSKVIIVHMMKRNVRERPLMKWRFGDMTAMDQFETETVDAIIDKGGLDSLIDPKSVAGSPTRYLFEVKRLLKVGGKYICVTFGETHTLALLFFKFRFGWKMTLHGIRFEPSSDRPEAFVVVAEKCDSTVVSQITLLVLGKFSPDRHGIDKANEFYKALYTETQLREDYTTTVSDVFIPYEDLVLVARENFSEFEPGRRLLVTLGDFGASRFFYDCILIDAPKEIRHFDHPFYVQVIPRIATLEWLLQPSEQQWLTVKTNSAARVLMIIIDPKILADLDKNGVLKDITPLVKQLAPSGVREITVIFASDGIQDRDVLHQVTSALSGLIVVDDVIYEPNRFPAKYLVRRLSIQSFLISEALFTVDQWVSSEVETNKESAATKTDKKANQGNPQSSLSESDGEGSSNAVINIDHSYLASLHHNAIISGLLLIYVHLETTLDGLMKTLIIDDVPLSSVKTVIIGLRAGLLSMFMNNCLPYLKIEVVETDPMILDISREYFQFREDGRLKVHIGDGVEFILDKANSGSDGRGSSKIDVLVVDVEVPYSRSRDGFTAPAVEFLDESFLLAVKKSLSENGLFIVNLIVWSSSAKDMIYSRLKAVFRNIFHLPLASDINEVIFALNSESLVTDDDLSEGCNELARSLQKGGQEWGQRVIDASKLIKLLQ